MKLMNWENLKKMLCPYCNEALTKDIEIRCTECFFHITEQRFKGIVEHRGFPDREIVRLKWQNVKEDRCPIDGMHLLPDIESAFEILKCSKQNCTFKIREDRLQAILKDPNHPANRFYKANEGHQVPSV